MNGRNRSMNGLEILVLVVAVAAIIGVVIFDQKKINHSGATLNSSLTRTGLNPLLWAKSSMMTANAETIAKAWKIQGLPEEEQGFMTAMRQMWEFRSDQSHGEPLDVQLQAFMLRPEMTEMLKEAEAGLIPLRPSELWMTLFACVLASGNHSLKQLREAIVRLEERAAERKRG
jgi:hypothetical protein